MKKPLHHHGAGAYIRMAYKLLMYLSIAAAAFLPAPIARITVAAPVTASPPANTPGLDVAPSSSATIPPNFCVSSPSVVDLISGLGDVPIDTMKASA